MILNSCYSHREVIIPKVGDTVPIGGVDYLVVHIDEANKHMYFAKKYCDMNVVFDSNGRTEYASSQIFGSCGAYYDDMLNDIKPLLVELECGYGCPVFIPTKEQVGGADNSGRNDAVTGQWDYFKDNASRIFKNTSDNAIVWWLQSTWPTDSSFVCGVSGSGYISKATVNQYVSFGFRPCFAMDMSILDAYSKFEAWKSIL
jgi:hypothetical protein